MSIFKVQLDNVNQGQLDSTAPTTTGTSLQRTAYVTGPLKVDRMLVDGATFTDCNFWKQYAYPQVPYDQAIVSVVFDDGSPWTNNPNENVYPYSTVLTVLGATTYTAAANTLDVLGTLGSYATFAQITSTQSINMRINGVAVVPMTANVSQIFNPGDFSISKLEFSNLASGASTATVNILLGLTVVPNS